MSDKSACFFCGDLASTDIRRVSAASTPQEIATLELCPKCFERTKQNTGLTITKRKFEIKNDKDYHQYLVGKCLYLAEDLALDDAMIDWLVKHREISTLESKIKDLKERINGDVDMCSGVWEP